nr:6566_t:CDS:1 [Entrophospora candida]
MSEEVVKQMVRFVQSLLISVPQYVLGSLSAIAILGATPVGGFREKIRWIFLCLGAPIEGLYYYCNVKNDAIIMSTYWLEYEHFYETNRQVKNGVTILNYRLFGWHTKQMELTPKQEESMKGCVAGASILDRLSYMVSIYYIIVGILAGIIRAVGPCIKEEWPYIPLALAWTLPAIFKRVIGGSVVVHDPNERIDGQIIVTNSTKDRRHNIIETGLFAMIAPWLAVLLAYFTNPVGYGCRSKFLTVLCGVWTLNNVISLLFNITRIRGKNIRFLVHCYFWISGAFVVFMLLFLIVLSNSRPLWVKIFGDTCADPKTPCLSITDIINQ